MSAIDAQNAKQIRDAMDVVIQLDATATSYGDVITITNENLIRATVSLRSDLSIIEPTLPESEINVEAYWPENVAEAVAAIPDDTPITYSAGYPGDMSPERKFYVSGQVTWADNVLTIHGVDGVHFLDYQLPTSVRCPHFRSFYGVVKLYGEQMVPGITTANISYSAYASKDDSIIIEKGQSVRDVAAALNQLMHQDGPGGAYSVWATYVDAGLPELTYAKPEPIWEIREEDCGDVKKSPERKIRSLTGELQTKSTASYYNYELVGQATIMKNVGAFLTFDKEPSAYLAGAAKNFYGGLGIFDAVRSAIPSPTVGVLRGMLPLVPLGPQGRETFANGPYLKTIGTYADKLVSNDLPQENYLNYPPTPGEAFYAYSQFVPWDVHYLTPEESSVFDWPSWCRSMQDAWDLLVNAGVASTQSDETTCEIDIVGRTYPFETELLQYSTGAGEGVDETIKTTGLYGNLYLGAYGTRAEDQELAFPDGAYTSLLQRSNVTGSFRWKGDPRQQPRDVATFVLRNGTEETITLENITIQHEKGGTYADYTYRKGIV